MPCCPDIARLTTNGRANPHPAHTAMKRSLIPLAIVATLAPLPTLFADESVLGTGNRIAYTRFTSFDNSTLASGGPSAISGDGTRAIYSSGKIIYTINTDGTGLTEVFDYADAPTSGAGSTPFVAINEDGSRIAWCNGFDLIYLANFDGSSPIQRVTQVNASGSLVAPKFTADRFKFALNNKLYFEIDLGIGANLQEANGIYSINADGTSTAQLFSFGDLTASVPKPPGEPDALAQIESFDVSDDGARVVGSFFHTLPSTSTASAPVFTWNSGAFAQVNPTVKDRGTAVAISGDGTAIAYYHPTARIAQLNNFSDTARQTVLTDPFGNLEVEINRDASLAVFSESGAGSSFRVTAFNPANPSVRLDLMPDHGFDGAASVKLVNGNRMLWSTGWLSPFGAGIPYTPVQQLFLVDLNPITTAGFPTVGGAMLMPQQIDRLARTPTTASAPITGAGTEVFMTVLANGEMRDSFQLLSLNDTGDAADIVGGDTHYTGHLRPYSPGDARSPQPGPHTMRVTAANPTNDRMLAADSIGPTVFEGPPPSDTDDADSDGTVQILEDAFVLNSAVSDVQGLPYFDVVSDGGSFYPGVTFRILPGSEFNPDLNRYSVGELIYQIEISENLGSWRVANDSEIVFLDPQPNLDGSESVSARFTTAFQDLTSNCFLRVSVSRGAPPFPGPAMGPGTNEGSTILTFDYAGSFDLEYGNRVKSATEGSFTYGGSGVFSPSIEVAYSSVAKFTSGYGDLINVIYASFGPLNVALHPDPGYSVRLNSFDLATFTSTDDIINSISITDDDGNLLFSQSNPTIPTEGHLTLDFSPNGILANGLTIRIDSTNLGSTSDNIGIDNISFDQVKNFTETSHSVLTFDIDGLSNSAAIDKAYGDRISTPDVGIFHYAGAGSFTPNVTADYFPTVKYYNTSYGDLRKILYTSGGGDLGFTIVLEADPGFEVKLHGFDLSTSGTVEPIRGVKIFDNELMPLYTEPDVALIDDGRRHFDLSSAPPQDGTIILRVDSLNIDGVVSRIGIDNISFSQVAVP